MHLHIQEVAAGPFVADSGPCRIAWYLLELGGAPSVAEAGQVALGSAASPQRFRTSSWEDDRAVVDFAWMAAGWSARRLEVEGWQQ